MDICDDWEPTEEMMKLDVVAKEKNLLAIIVCNPVDAMVMMAIGHSCQGTSALFFYRGYKTLRSALH